ncbi:unnamed protein product [Amoebophrya sp. A120]|nr:unnamed protein product [Amoebophrya sp. A120]|eukprot:GSA120T00018743001.1
MATEYLATSGGRSDATRNPRKTRRVASERRRLTLGTVDKKEPSQSGAARSSTGSTTAAPTDNHGLMQFLKTTNASDLVKTTQARRKLNLSSFHSDQTGQKSFDEKLTQAGPAASSSSDKRSAADKAGNEKTREELNKLGIGISCKKGMKPESPNQDAFSVLYVAEEFLLVGVYDGHGQHGHHISQFVKDALPKLFLNEPNRAKDPAAALQTAFAKCQKLIEHAERHATLQAGMSGSTCTLVYQILAGPEKGMIYVAHVGDSRAVMVSRTSKGAYTGRDLTRDHKPSLAEEKKRIEERGGRVLFDGFFNHRVFAKGQMYPGLNMSRAFGDCVAHREAGLCAEAEVSKFRIQSDDIGLLVCSDGVWEFLEAPEAAQHAMNAQNEDAQVGMENLAKVSWHQWMSDSDNEISDDITGVFVQFHKLNHTSSAAGPNQQPQMVKNSYSTTAASYGSMITRDGPGPAHLR